MDIVEEGNRLIHFEYEGIFEEILDRLGQMPLPPYITHQLEDRTDTRRFMQNTAFCSGRRQQDFIFTPELLKKIEEKGVQIARVTLHVGLGTFRPVKVDNILEHHMHSEFYQIEEEAAEKINTAKANGKRVIAVGTTSCRTIESAAKEDGTIAPVSGWTDIFIYPGYHFKCRCLNYKLPSAKVYACNACFCTCWKRAYFSSLQGSC